ncbi:MAG: hypothetical protein QOC96_1201 [Acidobacteriota bacterium]|jgi:hypothetical protein|nr:hypothetical protein [Acidobacteriota bacterium]
MVKRTSHGEDRHSDSGRPTSDAANDKAAATEIYLDIESGYYVFIGSRGRTHVFMSDGQHHTSFRTTRANRQSRVSDGKWESIERNELPDELK